VYFSLDQSGYAIVDSSKESEVDYLNANGSQSTSSYSGTGGVSMNSWLRKAAFALRFGDWNPLISSYVTPGSKILYVRDVRARVQTVAPFLSFDNDPYPVTVDGKIYYIIDGYTTSDHYPNAQEADTSDLASTSGLAKDFNYVRNSVKAVVDAYDGSVTLYVVDQSDPMIRAYESAFPKLFDQAQVPASIKDHFRYPEDMFTVQTNTWGRYHIEDPQAFYGQTAGWSIAQDPGNQVVNPSQTTQFNQAGQPIQTKEARVDPYYAILKLPGESQQSFMLFRSFVPFSEDDTKKTLSAFMVAKSDNFNDDYGQLVSYQVPSDESVPGPAIVGADISSNKFVSGVTTPLNQQGSSVTWGTLVLYPIDESLLYVRPLYVAAQGGTEVPQVQEVVASFGGQIAIQPTLQQALAKLFPDVPASVLADVGLPQGVSTSTPVPPPTGTGTTTTTGPTTSTTTPGSTTSSTVPKGQTVQQLLTEASALLVRAKADLVASCTTGTCDVTSYQNAVNLAAAYVTQASALESGAAASTTTTSGVSS
jgi:uncharacterized protein